jgi:hypothetical protein
MALTEEQVKNELPEKLHPYLTYITQIANIFVNAGMDEMTVQLSCICMAASNLGEGATAADFRDQFILQCRQNDQQITDRVQAAAMAIHAPGPPQRPVNLIPPPPVNYKSFYRLEITRVRAHRTNRSILRGRQLAAAAAGLKDWFYWVKSGPRDPDLPEQEGPVFGIKTAWAASRNDNTGIYRDGIEHHERKVNDFARWLVANGPAPGQTSSMNCWEAVFYSAFAARLVDKSWLQSVHARAAENYERQYWMTDGKGGIAYMNALQHTFGYFLRVPYKPQGGLIPREGDIVFYGDFDHVAVSLGRTWGSGAPQDRIMSLWHGNFTLTEVSEFNRYCSGTPSFFPCPF